MTHTASNLTPRLSGIPRFARPTSSQSVSNHREAMSNMLLHVFVAVVTTGVLVINAKVCPTVPRTGCTLKDGTKVEVGQQYDVPGYCNLNVCKGNNQWTVASCGMLGVPQGWTATPEDTSATAKYPACCSHLVAPLDLVPDLLDKTPGTHPIDVHYGANYKVMVGNELTPTQVRSKPCVNYSSWADPNSYYLLIMTDPDAPSRWNHELREFVHWIVANIPGNNINKGEEIVEYVGSAPSEGTGLHRYTFLLFRQPGKITFDEKKVKNTSTVGRMKFSTRKFAEKYNLGIPLALNVFLAQYDDSVPRTQQQLGVTTPPV